VGIPNLNKKVKRDNKRYLTRQQKQLKKKKESEKKARGNTWCPQSIY